MSRAITAAERLGERRAVMMAARVAEAVRDVAPDARVTREGATVTITGHGVIAALGWAGGLVR